MDKRLEILDYSEMSLPTPGPFSGEADFRTFVQRLLPECIERLQKGKILVRIPGQHGLYRLVDQMHFHLRAELFVQLAGKTHFYFPEEQFEVNPGEICIVPRGLPHYERAYASDSAPFQNVVFVTHGRTIVFHLARACATARPIIAIGTRLPATPALVSLFEEAAELDPKTQACALAACFSLVLAQMEGWTAPAEQEPFKVTHTRQLVSEQLSNPELSVAQLARQVQSSADYLSQMFRKTTGMPLSAYLNENRLQRARELLELSSLNIAEVSQAAGFADPAYFSRVFRRWQGMTPREYREAHS